MCALYCVQLFTAFQNVYMYTSLDIHGGPSSNLVSSPHQETPLHKAASEGHVGAVKYLMQAEADVTLKHNRGVSQ